MLTYKIRIVRSIAAFTERSQTSECIKLGFQDTLAALLVKALAWCFYFLFIILRNTPNCGPGAPLNSTGLMYFVFISD